MRRAESSGLSTAAAVVVLVLVVAAASIIFVEGSGVLNNGAATTTTSSSASVATTASSSRTVATTSTTRSTLATTTTTASSSSTTSSASSSIVVDSQLSNGSTVAGVYTELTLNGQEASTAYTPASFQTSSGMSYAVIVSDSPGLYFNHWTGGFTSRVMPVASNGSRIVLTAVFTTTPQSPPPTDYNITVTSHDLQGQSITGFSIELVVQGYEIQNGTTPVTFNDLEPGVQYQVVAGWGNGYYFRHFSDGELDRNAPVTLNATGTKSVALDAIYEYVPSSQASSLGVIAEFPNGTQIGTTVTNGGYTEQTPGLWVTITPPGAFTPYTGSYTGGSLLPFVLPTGGNYTVLMTPQFGNLKFARWSDTGSTDPARSVVLDSNMTLIAIFEES
ncbi:MAG: hypothetical protein ABSF83_10830 [Nitrososphaerales archaeon]|jgi:cytoskeletal protein RodZ